MSWITKDTKGKPLCNFTVHVVSVDKVYTESKSEPVETVHYYLDFGGDNEKEEVHSFPVNDIEKIHWKEVDKRCNYEPNASEKRVERHLSYNIRKALTSVPQRLVYKFDHVGMHTVNGRPVFYTGKKLIPSCHVGTDIIFETEHVEQKLDVDKELSEEASAAELFQLLVLSPDSGRIILAYKLCYLMCPAYESIGKIPKGSIYLYGESGTQKTTFSSFLVQTYDRSDGIKRPSRLNASIPAVSNMLLKSPNDVMVMDDLFPADSKGVRSKMEETLIEITRYVADGTIPARMKGEKLLQGCPRCGVIFTGEYLIGRGSDAARLLPVKMNKPDIKKLRPFLDRPLSVSTFYFFYISWFIEHYDEVCEILRNLWDAYESDTLNVHDRLREMYFILSSSYFLFLQYLYEKEIILDSDANRLYQSFNQLLVMLIKQQNERVQMGMTGQYANVDYWKEIRELYREKQFRIADGIDDFVTEQYDGVVHRDCLYLRRDCFARFFPTANLSEVIDDLEQQGALQKGRQKRTKQINKLNGMRFYVIPLSKL